MDMWTNVNADIRTNVNANMQTGTNAKDKNMDIWIK